MRVISRYETEELAEQGQRFRGDGNVVFLPVDRWGTYRNYPWALVA